jgi:hypothetical protein
LPHARLRDGRRAEVAAAGIIAANPRGAVYGTIVATAVIAATAGHQTPELVLAATVATLLVFWLAHVYSDFLDHGVRQAGFDLKVLPGIMARELSMLAAPALSILFLLLGALGLFDEELAVRLALWNGVAQLLGWVSTWDADAGRHGRRRCSSGCSTEPLGWRSSSSRCCCTDARAGDAALGYQWPRWTTESNGRRSGRAIGASGRSAG